MKKRKFNKDGFKKLLKDIGEFLLATVISLFISAIFIFLPMSIGHLWNSLSHNSSHIVSWLEGFGTFVILSILILIGKFICYAFNWLFPIIENNKR